MQHLVALVAGAEQAFGCIPHLRWLVVEKLIDDDLMHCQMKLRVDRSAVVVDRVSPALDGRVQFGMLGQDQNLALVFLIRVEETQFDAVELAALRWHSEQTPLFVNHTVDASQPTNAAHRRPEARGRRRPD